MPSADLTRYELSFGARDTYTGWYAKTYVASTIKGVLQPQGSNFMGLPVGSYAKYPNTLFTEDVVHEGDLVQDANLKKYELLTVTPWSWLDMFSHYVCEASLRDEDNRDATSGTWHVDSDSLTTDPRHRHKVYLDTYMDSGNVAGDYITCFDGADYPIKYLFNNALGLDLDAVICIGKEGADFRLDYQHKIYAYEETVPITIYAINKTGHTATNLIEQIQREIEHAFTDHIISIGSLRDIQATKHNAIDLGNRTSLWSTTVTVRYTRENDEYVPTLPSITWGPSAAPTGTFIFPNVLTKQERYVSNNLYMDMPGRSGSYPQKLGTKSLEVELTCDLDMEHSDLVWKRDAAAPWQHGVTPVDTSKWQVFQDIWHEGGESEAYQTLTLEWGSFQVCMDEPTVNQDGDRHTLTLVFHEYNASVANTDYRHRLGITH